MHANGQIAITTAANLDTDFEAEVDIVFVYSEAVLNQLPFEQFAWISTREEQIARFGNNIDVLSFTIAAGYDQSEVALPERQGEAIAVMVFASHADPVAEGIDITGESEIVLMVESWGISVE
ncbi:MAG: hypothetical protein IIC60_14520 [Proteobacteria bacterium]|nr:hypothetical protein [Pseudomonadota bacterium]